MRSYFFFILAALSCAAFCAQSQPSFNTHKLSIVWEPVQNNYQNKETSLSAITITNNDTSTFRATGWKLFFNDAGMLLPASPTGNAKFDFINGDLFSLTQLSPGLNPALRYGLNLWVKTRW
jgi:hexosaminidase